MLAVHDHVRETKEFILQQLDEMRAGMNAGDPTLGSEPSVGDTATKRPPSRLSSIMHGRRRQNAPSPKPGSAAVAHRLAKLEDRMMAMERAMLHGRVSSSTSTDSTASASLNRDPTSSPTQVPSPLPGPDSATPGIDAASGAQAYTLTGHVPDGLLTDVLQLLTSNQKTGRFALFPPDGAARLDLYFVDGEIAHAKAGDLEGEAAFFALMIAGHQAGKYGFMPEETHSGEASIERKTQFLILDALRRIDEELNGPGGNPPEDTDAGEQNDA